MRDIVRGQFGKENGTLEGIVRRDLRPRPSTRPKIFLVRPKNHIRLGLVSTQTHPPFRYIKLQRLGSHRVSE